MKLPSPWWQLLLPLLLLSGVVRGEEPTPESLSLAAHVLNRLGYGPRPGEIERVARQGVQRYVQDQLDPGRIALPEAVSQRLAALPVAGLSVAQLFRQYGPPALPPKEAGEEARKAARQRMQEVSESAHRERLIRAVESPRQLEEVMTEFWFNHFNVFEGKELVRIWAGDYERNAIRPRALGRFRDLLGATAHHPAMLVYLDNWQSSAPGSPEGRRARRGLNENYARELLELHTLGVNGGYTQADVQALARILTGWTLDVKGMTDGREQAFVFAEQRHDYGDKVLLGRTIQGTGAPEGELALDMLAAHPATARHVADRLARWFVADDPDPALVRRLAQRFLDTDGDIRAVLAALFESPEFLAPSQRGSQFKTPYQFAVSALRASELSVVNAKPIEGFLYQTAMPLHGWLTPDGYRTSRDAWLTPDAMLRRINFAVALGSGRLPLARPEPAARAAAPAQPGAAEGAMSAAAATPPDALPPTRPVPLDPQQLGETLGPLIGAASQEAVRAAAPGLRAALLLGSPDFMKR